LLTNIKVTEDNLLAVGGKADSRAQIIENALGRAAQAGNRVEKRLVFVRRIRVLVINIVTIGREGWAGSEVARSGCYDLGFATGRDLLDPEALLAFDEGGEAAVGRDGAGLRGAVFGKLRNLHGQRVDAGRCRMDELGGEDCRHSQCRENSHSSCREPKPR